MSIVKYAASFAGGLLFGTAGLGILATKEAKNVYVHTTAAALRAKDCTLAQATKIREEADDIVAEAKKLNEKKAEENCCEVIEDACCEKED